MNLKWLRSAVSVMTALSLTLSFSAAAFAQPHSDADEVETTTPIKHVVVIFQENISFDHYFATTLCPEHHCRRTGVPCQGRHAGREQSSEWRLADQQPNTVQPFRLSRSESVTCDQDHNYNDEQTAFDHGRWTTS